MSLQVMPQSSFTVTVATMLAVLLVFLGAEMALVSSIDGLLNFGAELFCS
jgi:hypothetical protein